MLIIFFIKNQSFAEHFSQNKLKLIELYYLLNIISVFYLLPSFFETVKDKLILEFWTLKIIKTKILEFNSKQINMREKMRSRYLKRQSAEY